MATIVIEKDDITTPRKVEDYIEYNEDNIPTVTVKVNKNRSKGRTFIHIRPRSYRYIYSDKVEMHKVAHNDEEINCFSQCITCDLEEKEKIRKEARKEKENARR
tara:strand:- start:292 stop:603 length:312 start_codon:yes stop_codon:yes gene_type:complete